MKTYTLWLNTVANTRIHGTTKEQPYNRWLLEKSFLRLAKNYPPYVTSPFMIRNSTKDSIVQYKSNFYSVPIKYARRKLQVKEAGERGVGRIEIYHEDKVIATHPLAVGRGQWIINDEHLFSDYTFQAQFHKKQVAKYAASKPATPIIVNRPLSYYDKLIPKGTNEQNKS